MNVEPTVEIIKSFADEFRHKANTLETVARKMSKDKDISFVTEAANIIRGTFDNLRIDLLVARPIMAMQEEIDRAKREAQK